jgi:hypothetical protein
MGKVTVDLKDAKEKWTGALERLKNEQQPGEAAGTGGLKTALDMMVPVFKTMTKDGYTAAQIAEALTKTNVAKILPKHVTEAIGRADKGNGSVTGSRKRARNRKAEGTEQKVDQQPMVVEETSSPS